MRHLLSAAMLAFLSVPAAAATVDFTTFPLGTAAGPLTSGIVTATGSAPLFVTPIEGLGVGDFQIDSGEIVTISFARPVTSLRYGVTSAYCEFCGGTSVPVGSRVVDVFGVGGSLLGSFTEGNIFVFDVSSRLAGNPGITSVMFAPIANHGFTLGRIQFEPPTGEPAVVPLPASLPLMLAGLAAFGLARRRQARG